MKVELVGKWRTGGGGSVVVVDVVLVVDDVVVVVVDVDVVVVVGEGAAGGVHPSTPTDAQTTQTTATNFQPFPMPPLPEPHTCVSDGTRHSPAAGESLGFVTVTERGVEEREGTSCRWCGRPVVRSPGSPGRPREFCRRSCRQRAYEARRRAQELGLGEHELVVTRAELDELRDQAFVVRSAIHDARRSMDRISDVRDARELLEWIVQAAEALP